MVIGLLTRQCSTKEFVVPPGRAKTGKRTQDWPHTRVPKYINIWKEKRLASGVGECPQAASSCHECGMCLLWMVGTGRAGRSTTWFHSAAWWEHQARYLSYYRVSRLGLEQHCVKRLPRYVYMAWCLWLTLLFVRAPSPLSNWCLRVSPAIRRKAVRLGHVW